MKVEKFHFGYIPALDGVRGIAVFLVMMFHSGVFLFQGGAFGVDIFFVLSGFLITGSLVKEFSESQNINIKNFYVRRFLRLFPALITFLVVVNLLAILTRDSQKIYQTLIDSVITLLYFSDWAYALHLTTPLYLLHTWSLAIEEQFYIFWPLLLFQMLRVLSLKRVLAVIVGLCALAYLWRVAVLTMTGSIDRVYFGADTRLDELLSGCALAIFLWSGAFAQLQHRFAFLRQRNTFLPITSCLLLLLISFVGRKEYYATYYVVMSLVEILVVIVVLHLVTVKTSILKRFFETKLLVFIGRISYGLYLWHFIVYKVLGNTLHVPQTGIIIGGTLLTFLICTGSYYIIEQPALRLKSRFTVVSEGRKAPLDSPIPLVE